MEPLKARSRAQNLHLLICPHPPCLLFYHHGAVSSRGMDGWCGTPQGCGNQCREWRASVPAMAGSRGSRAGRAWRRLQAAGTAPAHPPLVCCCSHAGVAVLASLSTSIVVRRSEDGGGQAGRQALPCRAP